MRDIAVTVHLLPRPAYEGVRTEVMVLVQTHPHLFRAAQPLALLTAVVSTGGVLLQACPICGKEVTARQATSPPKRASAAPAARGGSSK